ncbi:hypothetical protein BKK55_10800 [Rodentibacter genomosp. 2]|uniref:Uncharacterized protein n=1 Tax=Rodentibacter genomosp. 2 TaxID=1908266 RepID=A0A1V3JC20_9PAST|nr:hypothetical protein BKK55_10800 [Rodentibacter genomosp. 2]
MENAILDIVNSTIIFMGFIAMMLFIGPALGGVILWFFISLCWYLSRLKKSYSKIATLIYYGISALYIVLVGLYILSLLTDFKGTVLLVIMNSVLIWFAHKLATYLVKKLYCQQI